MNALEQQLLDTTAGGRAPRLAMRTRTRIDAGRWWRPTPVWLCVLEDEVVLLAGTLTVLYSATSGLWGVVVTDFLLFALAMVGSEILVPALVIGLVAAAFTATGMVLGGDPFQLGAHIVSALLNARSGFTPVLTEAQVINIFNANAESYKRRREMLLPQDRGSSLHC